MPLGWKSRQYQYQADDGKDVAFLSYLLLLFAFFPRIRAPKEPLVRNTGGVKIARMIHYQLTDETVLILYTCLKFSIIPLISSALKTKHRRIMIPRAEVQPIIGSKRVTDRTSLRMATEGQYKNQKTTVYSLKREAKKNMAIMVQEEDYR